jgi:hypothetical protein
MSTATPVRAFSKSSYYDRIGYEPHDGQRDIHFTPSRFKVVSNGRRWGKTIFGAREAEPCAFTRCPITGKAQLGWIVGPQYTDAEKEFRIFYDSMREQGVDRDSIKFLNNPDSGSLHIKTNWGFELLGRSAAHPETLVGEGLNFVLMVEAGRHKRRTWGQFIRPALSDRRGWAAFTGVPEGKTETSLLYALYQRGQSESFPAWNSWKRPSWTNTITFPGGRNDPEILDAEEDLTKDEFDRQYGAEFTERTGIVMQEWDDDLHLADLHYDQHLPLFMAVDYGFTNPFVVLWIQVDPITEQIRVIGERRWQKLDTPEVAKDILAEFPTYVTACRVIYPDPAEPDDTMTLERMLRIPSHASTGGSLRNRLTLIRTALHDRIVPTDKPRLVIDRNRCAKLAWEMREGYKWPEHRSEATSDSENPMDKDNHGIEALGRFFRGMYRSPAADGGTFQTTARMG